ncbi:hypothetical protein [Falsiroseomonas sp. HW251]|uniref:hypothetical protein n=1 Tax=Falsiroseomonas sp. HW251 TaxID=3390998 RepID=UPI003D323E21
MIRLANLTSAALLDHVQALLVRTARGRRDLPARAFLADEEGRVTLVELPALAGAADHRAAGAILGALARDRAASHAVVQLPHRAGPAEAVALLAIAADGSDLGQRLLTVERRRDGRVARLLRPAGRATGAVPSAA